MATYAERILQPQKSGRRHGKENPDEVVLFLLSRVRPCFPWLCLRNSLSFNHAGQSVIRFTRFAPCPFLARPRCGPARRSLLDERGDALVGFLGGPDEALMAAGAGGSPGTALGLVEESLRRRQCGRCGFHQALRKIRTASSRHPSTVVTALRSPQSRPACW